MRGKATDAMRQAEIEFWALGVIATVSSGGRVEDGRVELKANWPDPIKAARRLAGHANAARGEEVLWLLGVDERKGVVGVDADDLANWWSVTSSNFMGPAPAIIPVSIPQGSATVLALLIETVSAPFVVKNPAFGTPQGGPVELEVPWREMTSIRSARHSDLIRLLVPQLKLPLIEVLDARLEGIRLEEHVAVREFGPGFRWKISLTLYVVPRSAELLVFPSHLMRVTVKEPVALGELELEVQSLRSLGRPKDIIEADLVVERPSRIFVEASAGYERNETPGDHATLVMRSAPAGSDRKIVITCELDMTAPNQFRLARSAVSTS